MEVHKRKTHVQRMSQKFTMETVESDLEDERRLLGLLGGKKMNGKAG